MKLRSHALIALLSLVAAFPLAAQRLPDLDPRAVARAQEMLNARATSVDVAQEMQRSFRLDAQTTVRVLAAVRFTPDAVAQAGVAVYQTDAASLAAHMAAAGMNAAAIAGGLNRGARISGRAVLDALDAAGLANLSTPEVLRATGVTPPDLVAFLRDRGERPASAASQLRNGLGQREDDVIRLLLAGGYEATDVGSAGLQTLRMSPGALAGVLQVAEVPAEAVAMSFTRVGINTDVTSTALQRAGYTAGEAARAMVNGAGVEPFPAYTMLLIAGYLAEDLNDAVEENDIPLAMDCLGPNQVPVPCGNFGSGSNEPVMGQVTWSPQGSAEVGTVVTFNSTNIPAVDVLLGGQALEVLEMTASRVRARLPNAPTSGALAFRRQSDNVIGVIEENYSVVDAPEDPMAGLSWSDAADAALEGALEDADDWIRGSRFVSSECTVVSVAAAGTPGVLSNNSAFEGAVRDRLLEEGFPEELASAWQDVFEEAFLDWADNVTIPGLPWSPAFALVSTSEAPEMPNVSTPLASLLSTGAVSMTPPSLAQALRSGLPGTEPSSAEAAITTFATEWGATFAVFVSTAMVQNVMGSGPVPSPPGMVIGGSCYSPGMWSTRLPSGITIQLPGW